MMANDLIFVHITVRHVLQLNTTRTTLEMIQLTYSQMRHLWSLKLKHFMHSSSRREKKEKDIHLSSFFFLLLFKVVLTLGPFSISSEQKYK